MTSAETEIYHSTSVLVTTQRVVVDSSTYAVRNLTSVRPETKLPDRRLALVLIIIGAGLTIVGGTLVVDVLTNVSVTVLAVGLGALAFGIFLWRREKTTYAAIATTAAGEMPILESEDEREVRDIVAAIGSAIVQHRA